MSFVPFLCQAISSPKTVDARPPSASSSSRLEDVKALLARGYEARFAKQFCCEPSDWDGTYRTRSLRTTGCLETREPTGGRNAWP